MRKIVLSVALVSLLTLGGCRAIWGGFMYIPNPTSLGLGKWIDGGVLNIYTGNGHYDGKARWDNFTKNWQQIQNVMDIHFFNYDIRDPYVNAPFFGDPR